MTMLPGSTVRPILDWRAIVLSWPLIAATLWLIRFATLGHILPWQTPIWSGWFDQNHYLASTVALAHGNLSSSQHWYPLGYSLAATPFEWIVPFDPFLALDLVLYLATCLAFRRVAGRLGIGPHMATACFLATTILQTGLASAWAQPWTSTLSAALIWWLLERALLLTETDAPDRRALMMLGGLAGALPLVRPVDALIGSTALSFAVAVLAYRNRLSARRLLHMAAGIAMICLPYLALHLAIYGPHATPYMNGSAKAGFAIGDIGWKAHILLVNPKPWFPDPNSRSILSVLPWIVPGLAGLVAWAISRRGTDRITICLLLAAYLPVSLLMLTYTDLQPPGLWYFGNVHYFKWGMPIFGCGIILFVRIAMKRSGRWTLAPVLVALIVPICIRIDPKIVGPETPARMLVFRSNAHRGWQEAYFSPVVITDGGGAMRNVQDFHQIPDGSGEREIAINRLFQHDAVKSDPGEPVDEAKHPYARFAEHISFGLP